MLLLLLNTSPVQNYIAKKITASISKKIGAQVSIRKVSISPFNKLNIEGILIRDQKKDTLLYANLCKIRITDWFFLKKNATLSYVGIEDAVVKINRKTKTWNYEFITNYFKTSDTTNKTPTTQYDIKKIDLKSVRFEQNDLWTGSYMKAGALSLVVDCKKINVETGFIQLGTVSLDQPSFVMKVIPALQPANYKETTNTNTPKSKSQLNINADEINISKGSLVVDSDFEKPYPLPNWAKIIFSPMAVGIIPNDNELDKLTDIVIHNFDMYMKILDGAKQNEYRSEYIIASQNRYCDNQQKNERTYNVLKAKLGEEKAKYFMQNILFPKID